MAKNAESLPPVSAMSQELSKKFALSPRRLQKYLTKSIQPKELSITLNDLFEFSKIKGGRLGDFVSYLLEEDVQSEMNVSQKKLIDAYGKLHEGHRRKLAAGIFSGKEQKKTELIIGYTIKVYTLNDKDIRAIGEIIEAFHERMIWRKNEIL